MSDSASNTITQRVPGAGPRTLAELVRDLDHAGLLSDPRVRALADMAYSLIGDADVGDQDGDGVHDGDDDDGQEPIDLATWLADLLESGPVDRRAIEEAALEDGYSVRSLDRAACQLGVVRRRVGYQGGSIWSLPG